MFIARKSVAPLVAVLGLMVGGPVEAKVVQVTVTGEVAAVKGDRSQTEALVKRDARRRAVEQGAGTSVSSNTIIRNYQMVSDEIVTSAKGLLVSEEWGALQLEGDIAKIQLTAQVSPDAIDAAVCTVVKAKQDPKIAIVMVETRGKDGGDWKVGRGLVEALLSDRLMESCFSLVEPGFKVTEVSAQGDIPADVVEKLVETTNAQYVFVGASQVIESDVSGVDSFRDTGMRSFSVTLTGRLINTSSSEVEASVGETAQIMGVSAEHALKFTGKGKRSFQVIDKVVEGMMERITKRWSDGLVNASKVSLIVQNVKNFKTAQAVDRSVLGTFPRATLHRRSLKGGTGVWDAEIDGGADELASRIDGKKVERQTIEVVEVTGNKVVIKLN
jgi:hypothetical protein